MSLPEADRHARYQIEYHREQMGEWKKARAQRIVTEYDSGRSVEDIAEELGVSAATVYEVMRAVRAEPKKRGRRPKRQQEPESPT